MTVGSVLLHLMEKIKQLSKMLICVYFSKNGKITENLFQQYCMSKDAYENWKDKTLAYYASQGVEMTESEDLDTETRLKRRNELFSGK